MGGVKKKPISAVEKQQRLRDEREKRKEAKKKKREVTKSVSEIASKPLEALTVQDIDRILERLRPLKALTVYSVMRALGVRASVANTLLKNLVSKGVVVRVGGYSGHHVYALREPA